MEANDSHEGVDIHGHGHGDGHGHEHGHGEKFHSQSEVQQPKPEGELNEFEVFNSNIDIKTLPIFTRMQLAQYDGELKPEIYVGIRGYIYDVTNNSKSYGPGKSYHKLVGKDVSRLLGLNKLQLKPGSDQGDSYDPFLKDNTWYTGDLSEKQNQIVDKWILFFKKRYRIVGIIVDHNVDRK